LAINNFEELFWKLFKIAGGGSSPDVIKVLQAIVPSDRAKLEQYFSNVIDQLAFNSDDWNRLRKYFIDLFTAVRSPITQSYQMSDPHFLSNSDLDELFRSFGYPESTRLKDYNEDPLESKVQFFLDLVNLYKIKGTPRSILETLQYYGISKLDIFEFWLRKKNPDELYFRATPIVGTSVRPSPFTVPYDVLTAGDPHWMMRENQILELDRLNKVNLPSKTPYFAVQPIIEAGVENAIFIRMIQDQYFQWLRTGELPPQNAEISILGITTSLLELYLLTLYEFHKDYDIGSFIERFACYDGTNADPADIVDEYQRLINGPITRDSRRIKYQAYLDLFSREIERHFLYGTSTAESVLNLINPALIPQIDSVTGDNTTVLQSLLKDIAIWVRNNMGFGFVNLGYIFFGLAQLFEDLKPVINFFKPYRARLIILELLQFKNILTESIPIEDEIVDFTIGQDVMDFMTGDSSPCCADMPIPPPPLDSTSDICVEFPGDEPFPPMAPCADSTSGSFYSRNTYDCGSYFDIGAATDPNPVEIDVLQSVCDPVICGVGCPVEDTTANITATYGEFCDRLSGLSMPPGVPSAPPDSTSGVVVCDDRATSVTLAPDCTSIIPFECGNIPIVFSEKLPGNNNEAKLFEGTVQTLILFKEPYNTSHYSLNINIVNEVDGSSVSQYGYIIIKKSRFGFIIKFSDTIDSPNYKLLWSADRKSAFTDTLNLNENINEVRVPFPHSIGFNRYTVLASMVNETDEHASIYKYAVVSKDSYGFNLQFSGFIDSTNYSLDWSVVTDSTAQGIWGMENIPEGDDKYIVHLSEPQHDSNYSLGLSLVNLQDATVSIYLYSITKKDLDEFEVSFSGPMDSTNYYLSWTIEQEGVYEYRQESGFRNFDSAGRFDCTTGFDLVEIRAEYVVETGAILQENDYLVLQENSGKLLLDRPPL